jgi:hypothetical protein
MEGQDLLLLALPGYYDQVSAVKIYGREVWVFLFVKICISAKLIFHIMSRKGFGNLCH